jgi:hypothetical protein
MAEVLNHVPGEADSALSAAQVLVTTALNRLAVIGEREIQTGLNIRRITLQHRDPQTEQNTLLQIIERDIPGWEAGNLWVNRISEAGYSSTELPRTPTITRGNIRHLMITQSEAQAATAFTELAGQLAEATQVPNAMFVQPRELYRKPKREIRPIITDAKSRVVGIFKKAATTARHYRQIAA